MREKYHSYPLDTFLLLQHLAEIGQLSVGGQIKAENMTMAEAETYAFRHLILSERPHSHEMGKQCTCGLVAGCWTWFLM